MSSVPASLGAATGLRHASRAWRNAVAIVALLASVFFLYAPTSESLMELWSDTGKTTYTHGFVIAALTAWLVLRRRHALAAIPWSPSIVGSLLALAASVVWIVSVRASIELFHQLLLLGLLWLSVWAVFGRRMALQLWLPVGFLIFAIPVWDQINFLLQKATVKAVALLLAVTAIPAWVDGNFVHLAAGVFEVAGGCSGIHFFIVALSLATLYGEIGRDSWKVRIQLVALATGLALLANWLRVYTIVLAGYLTNMQHSLIREGHYNFGWVVFAVVMLVFFLLARRFASAPPENHPLFVPESAHTSRAAALMVAVVCVLAAPVAEFFRPVRPAMLAPGSSHLLRTPNGWSRTEPAAVSAWTPIFAGADLIERSQYASSSGGEVQMFIASFALQEQQKEIVAYGNGLIGPGEGSVVSDTRAVTGRAARELFVRGPAGRSVIRYYYDIGGHRTDRAVFAQLWYGLKSIRGEVVSSVFALRTECAANCDEARALLSEFDQSLGERSL